MISRLQHHKKEREGEGKGQEGRGGDHKSKIHGMHEAVLPS
jgi:hypothetical protein